MNTKLNNWFLLPPENNISKVGIFSEFYNMNTYFGFNYLLKDDYRDNIYTSGYCGCEYYIDPYNHRRNSYTDKPSLGPLQDNKIGSGTASGYFDETAELLEYRIDFQYFAFNTDEGKFYDWGGKSIVFYDWGNDRKKEYYDGSGCSFGSGDIHGRN